MDHILPCHHWALGCCPLVAFVSSPWMLLWMHLCIYFGICLQFSWAMLLMRRDRTILPPLLYQGPYVALIPVPPRGCPGGLGCSLLGALLKMPLGHSPQAELLATGCVSDSTQCKEHLGSR